MVLLLMRKANEGNTPTHYMIPKKRYCATYFPENKVDWHISLLFYTNYNQLLILLFFFCAAKL